MDSLKCDIETGICEINQVETVAKSVETVSKSVQKPVKLLYFTDPICSSCWGIDPQLRKLKQEYGQYFDIEYRMGGLLKSWSEYGGSDVNGPASVATHWDEASKYYNMPIDGSVWLEDPLPSSYPPSIAFKAAQIQDSEKAYQFLRRIKEMVFIEKKNIAKWEFLKQAALESGLQLEQFEKDYNGKAQQLFNEDLSIAREWGVRGFPTIFFLDDEDNQLKVYGSKPYEVYEQALLKLVNKPVVKNLPHSFMDIFQQFNSATLQEFAVYYSLELSKALAELAKLESEKRVEKSITKAGQIWHKNR